jgi:hypothetical protein
VRKAEGIAPDVTRQRGGGSIDGGVETVLLEERQKRRRQCSRQLVRRGLGARLLHSHGGHGRRSHGQNPKTLREPCGSTPEPLHSHSMPADLVQGFEIRSWTVAHLLWPIAKQNSPACASRLPDSRPLRRLCSELDVQSRHTLLEDEPAGMRSCRDGLVRHSQQRRWERTDVAGQQLELMDS